MIPVSNNTSIATGKFYAALSRPQNVVFSGALCVLMYLLTGGKLLSLTTVALYILIAQLYTFASTLNNMYDVPLDKANSRTGNPLALQAAPHNLRIFLGIVAVILLVMQWFMAQPQTLLLVMAYIGLSLAYSAPFIHLKKRGLLGTAALSVCYVAIPMAIGWVQGAPLGDHEIITIAGVSLLAGAGLLAKDYKDIKGDSLYGIRTPLVRYGKSGVVTLAYIFIAVGCVLLWASSSWIVLLAIAAYTLAVRQIHKRNGVGILWYRTSHVALLFTSIFIIWR